MFFYKRAQIFAGDLWGALRGRASRSFTRARTVLVHKFNLFVTCRLSWDHRGRQVFFYKRAQIFAGDLWGAFGGRGYGEFQDIAQLTMFADYR